MERGVSMELKSHEKFHSVNEKRLILVADDEQINRELLGAVLNSDYEVIYAADGQETLMQVNDHHNTLSLILLDLMMPAVSGLEVLKKIRDDPVLKAIPVIVVTADRASEIESLSLGAIDFIPKPYPQPGVILARVRRTIELSEDREIISYTERDPLTGLYNREFFYRYGEQFDQHHPDADMDAIVIDVNHFHMINERYGKNFGDQVLREIGEKVRSLVSDKDGIVCRRSADTFLVYCRNGLDYKTLLEKASVTLENDESVGNRVRLRMGVYADVDKSIEIEQRFDRAKMAADSIQRNFTGAVGFYDKKLHEMQRHQERLLEDFQSAIREKQFLVYYQPKFDIRQDPPALSSAEALVRWNHPELGFVSPGEFIPLFEENGMIEELDHYVWEETGRQIHAWKDKLGMTIPVSVNVSRIDLFNVKLPDQLQEIVRANGLSTNDILLEITESAYTQDSEQIIEMVNQLRAVGFQIEMDDFGTGYSSLNMISTLPIDVLKLDMNFIREAFKENGDVHMLRVIIGIAEYLSVPVVAEGVEEESQLRALKRLNCNLVQGYYFSKPVPPEEFERFIEDEKKHREEQKVNLEASESSENEKKERDQQISTGISSLSELTENKQKGGYRAPRLRTSSIAIIMLALLASTALFLSDIVITRGYRRMEQASRRYIVAQLAASNMEDVSDYLTDRVRCFVVTGEASYLQDFFEEVEITRRRDQALNDLEELLEGNNSTAYANLATALQLSNELVEREYRAMRLMLEADSYHMDEIPEAIADVVLEKEDLALTREQQKRKAQELVFDNVYMDYKDRIRENVNLCTHELIQSSSNELEQASAQMAHLVRIQEMLTSLFLLIVLLIAFFISRQIRRPLSKMVELMQQQEPVPPTGAAELQFVTRTYNAILEENREAHEKLSHEAKHDALTGLLNRGAYELMLKTVDTRHIALVLVDIDYFKSVNDTYGHDVGDRVLRRVAEILKQSFRSVDIICRIGGDEFVVIMTRADSSMRKLLEKKIAHANELLQNPKDDLPPVSLSVGAAFSDRENPQGDIFKDADTALYRVKQRGRRGCEIY